VLAKYALAQAKESDGALDQAAALYSQIATCELQRSHTEQRESATGNCLQQADKKKEASDILFNMVSEARNAKDKDGKAVPESAASRAAAQELLKIDPARHAQLPAPPAPPSMF
jgi:hypothetical protein